MRARIVQEATPDTDFPAIERPTGDRSRLLQFACVRGFSERRVVVYLLDATYGPRIIQRQGIRLGRLYLSWSGST
jgi:hypothetical protein